MCIIIQREPGFVIPREKFDNCVINNPDGWGLSASDGKGSLVTVREVAEGGTDANKLYEMLNDEFKDDRVLLHLRYNTAGKTILRNAHPFPILEYNTDGLDLRMAHNGTIHKYKDAGSDLSDTRNFVLRFVRPLFKRMAEGVGLENLLSDPFIKELLEDKIPTASVLSFLDGLGNTLNINALGNGGGEEEGWYFSNKYSFDPKHRVPAVSNIVGYQGNNARSYAVNGRSYEYPSYSGCNSWMDDFDTTMEDTDVPKFTTKYSMVNPEDWDDLSDETIEMIVEEEQGDAVLLIKELLGLRLALSKKVDHLEKANAAMALKLKEVPTNVAA